MLAAQLICFSVVLVNYIVLYRGSEDSGIMPLCPRLFSQQSH